MESELEEARQQLDGEGQQAHEDLWFTDISSLDS